MVELCAEHAAFEGTPYEATGARDRLQALLFGETPGLHGLMAETARGVVGYATWAPQISTWNARRYAYMDCLFLRPEARNQGAGQALVAALVRDVRAAGLDHVQWQTPSQNTRAMRFYKRLGATQKDKARFFLSLSDVHA